MKIRKTEGGLAVELPANVIEDLGLKEGDDVNVRLAGLHKIEIEKPLTREEAIELLRASRTPLPQDYKFNREELHER